MAQIAIQGPTQVVNKKTGQTISLSAGTHYLSEDWNATSVAQPVSQNIPAPVQPTQPAANPWYGIPASISGISATNPQGMTFEQAQQYWQQPTQPSSQSNTDAERQAIITAFQQTYGYPPSEDQIRAVINRGGYINAGGNFAAGVDMAKLTNAVQSVGGANNQGFETIYSLADLIAKSGKTMDQLRQDFLATTEGQEFEANTQKVKQKLEKQYSLNSDQLGYKRQELEQDYQNYLDDINEGRIQAGSTYDRERLANLEQRNIGLQQQQQQLTKNIDTINRGFIARGGLFSGPREQMVGETQSAADLARQAYEQTYGLSQQRLGDTYNQQLQSYTNQQQKAGVAKTRGLEELGYQGQLQQLGQEQGLTNIANQQTAIQEELLQKKYNQQWY